MALTTTTQDLHGDGSVLQVTWNHLDATNNVGAAIAFSQWADRSVQIQGTFNAAAVIWEGSNDNGNSYLPLTNPQGNPINNVTTATIMAVTEVCGLARPRTSGGGGNQDIVVSAVLRRATQLVR
jgi:hypothetical protein